MNLWLFKIDKYLKRDFIHLLYKNLLKRLFVRVNTHAY